MRVVQPTVRLFLVLDGDDVALRVVLRWHRLAFAGPFVSRFVSLCPELGCGIKALPLLRLGLVGARVEIWG